MALIRVVLPAPSGPTMASISPGRTSRSIPLQHLMRAKRFL